MPHVKLTMFPGRSEETIERFARAVQQDAVEILGCEARHFSLEVELCAPNDWQQKVYDPHIKNNLRIVLQPNYEEESSK